MKIKIKYKCFIYSNGKIKNINHIYECPDFEDITKPIKKELQKILNATKYTITVNEQIMEWLYDQDKIDCMLTNDAHTIINYEVVKVPIKSKSLRKVERQNRK